MKSGKTDKKDTGLC